ncbi:GTPase Era [Candidatus Bilamarchaeum dharawalense]|uniref:GTPase Era n=1 Tax=Candidatus Bilamarchaeum dharawalense TaxID=2885759 RepID=A0A5E4LMQ9_9ARCH|nr:GTPase Era [Candidatus Bilamarchaeum dharawalense]
MVGRERGKMNPWFSLKKMIHGVDVVIEVIDARDMDKTRLPLAEKWSGSKRLLMVANKTDLLPKGTHLPKLENGGVYISAKTCDEEEGKKLVRLILARTENRPAKALIIGYPNVGKSTLINMLVHRKVARVSAVAGTTKNMQWINVGPELIVTDYRGMFPVFEKKDELVRKGALNVQGDEDRYAHGFAEKILKSEQLRKWLEKKYDVDLKDAKNSEELLAKIAERRKWFLKGGELNLQEAARNLVRAMMEAPEM